MSGVYTVVLAAGWVWVGWCACEARDAVRKAKAAKRVADEAQRAVDELEGR